MSQKKMFMIQLINLLYGAVIFNKCGFLICQTCFFTITIPVRLMNSGWMQCIMTWEIFFFLLHYNDGILIESKQFDVIERVVINVKQLRSHSFCSLFAYLLTITSN